MYGECATTFLNVQEFQAKCKKFPAQLAHVQEEYEEASCTCQKYGDLAGIFPIYTFSFLPALFEIIPTLFGNLPTHCLILPAYYL